MATLLPVNLIYLFIADLDPVWCMIMACAITVTIDFGIWLTKVRHFIHGQS